MNILSIEDFGRELVETRDLDPVYVLVYEAGLLPDQLRYWLVAYWCFYHVGTASWITEGLAEGEDGYYSRLLNAAMSKEYPRCPERRHFRGENARKSVEYIRSRGVRSLFATFDSDARRAVIVPVSRVTATVQQWTGFGPWIAFKVADMLERLDLLTVCFDTGTTFYESPYRATQDLWRRVNGPLEVPSNSQELILWVTQYLKERLCDLTAPPRYERPLQLQEYETVLCKYGSYCKGRYKVGEDLESSHKALKQFTRSGIAQRLRAAGKRVGLW